MKKTYLQAGEGYEMKCTEQELINNLIEMYTYHFKQAREIQDKMVDEEFISEDDLYNLGKENGAIDAVSAIMLSVIGGGDMYDIWIKTLDWLDNEKVK